MHEIWNTRTNAMSAIESELQIEANTIYQTFSLLDEMLGMFNSPGKASTFSRVVGLTLLKGRCLAQGIFSLTLDGLAQEAGALLRPLIECIELLRYFYDNPQRVDEALEERLPSAGEIAKLIHGESKKLRNYLNKHASHISFAPESMSHMIDFESGDWRVFQPFNEKALRRNISILFAVLVSLLFESANCLDYCALLSDSLEDRLSKLRESGLAIFKEIPKE